MKKLYMIISIMLLAMFAAVAQAPERFSYQAVVRNANNQLVTNANVGVRVSVLHGSATGNSVYTETHTAGTNANGLLTVEIGGGNAQQGSFQSIDWGSGSYFLKTEVDPNGGSNYSITSVQQLMSVPYALYAKEAGNVPQNVGELTNDANYITLSQVPAQVNADWNATSGAAQILNKPTLFSGNYNDLTNKPVLFSGDYNDLTNLPQIPQIPADVSAFNNDVGYITMDSIPAIPTVPTNVSAFNNDAGYLTGFTETDPTVPAWAKEANKPAYDYSEIANTPTIPTVPTNVSAFDNDAGYVTANDIPAYQVLSISNDTIYLSNGGYAVLPPGFDGDYNSLTNRPNLFSGSYNDLTDTPTIPTVPSNVSAFTNDAGYLTSFTEQQVLSISNDTIFLTGGSIVKLPAGFSGDYNDLTNLPQIPQIPADISAFTNDAGYITGYTETDPQFNAWDKDYNDLINKPAIPAVPTNVSAFTNDAGYITAANVQEAANIPTNVSAFNNDAGYITSADIPEIPTMPTNVSVFNNDAGYITSADIPEIPTVPTNVSAFTNDAHYITDVQLQQIMNTIASMQNTIDSMGLVMEVLYNQINQSDSIPAGIDTGLQVTFTTTGYTNEPAVHQSDLLGTNFIHNYASTNGLTGDVNDWWIFESNRLSQLHTTTVYTNKAVTGFTILKYSPGGWFSPGYDISHFRLDENDPTNKTIIFEYYHEGDERWELERALYAIKFVVEEPLQVTFTTSGYTNEPAVKYSDVSQAGFFQTPSSSTGLTGNINDWWIWESNRTKKEPRSYVYATKPFTGITVKRWDNVNMQWIDPTATINHFSVSVSGNTTTVTLVHYDEVEQSFDREQAVYAIKFND